MIHFFGDVKNKVFAVQTQSELAQDDVKKLTWLFGNQNKIEKSVLTDFFVGPRAAMITPWSTNAVEITQNMCISGILRIEEFVKSTKDFTDFDPMLSQKYSELNQEIFTIQIEPETVKEINDINAYNTEEGLALSEEEVEYLKDLSVKLNRKLTDSEVFGFSQVNSEHCRHKIFNGTFIIDGEENFSIDKLVEGIEKVLGKNTCGLWATNYLFKNKIYREETKPVISKLVLLEYPNLSVIDQECVQREVNKTHGEILKEIYKVLF